MSVLDDLLCHKKLYIGSEYFYPLLISTKIRDTWRGKVILSQKKIKLVHYLKGLNQAKIMDMFTSYVHIKKPK